ncbi:hypothetical protein [Nibribacter koreensis]|uniref:SpoIIAA-like n=1 Tax=Nibribacter koreensis TaxID=1084519 RepID=A0ABP8FA78_9BACT
MLTFETDFYQVSLDDTNQVAILFWKREVTLPEFQEGSLALREVIKQYQLNKWLVNSTHKGLLSPEAEDWLTATIFDNAGDKFLMHQVAYVMTEEKYQEMVQDYSLLRASHKKLPLEIHYFTSQDEALHWMVHEHTTFSHQ